MKMFACLLLMAAVAGCGKNPDKTKADEFFSRWLKDHGETNVVVDANGVGVAGNKTRLSASIYQQKNSGSDYSVEMEFKVSLPAGGPIIEYVAGAADTKEKAVDSAMSNFVLTTAHVVYKAFMNPADEHQRVKSILMNGKPRDLYAGNMIQFAEKGGGPIGLDSMSTQIQDLVAAKPLASGPHWIKVIYSQDHGKQMIVAVTLDNGDETQMTSAVQNLKWPQREEFYMVKQFIIIK